MKNLTQKLLRGPATWKDMLKNALRDIANWRTKKIEQLYKVSSPCSGDHHFKKEELESVGELSIVCKMNKSLWQTLGSFDLRHSSHNRLPTIFHVGNTAKHCRWGLFQDSDFAGDLEDSKSTSAGILCIFGSRTFVPISWVCKKQTSVSHSSTESEIISLDAGLRTQTKGQPRC